MGRTITSLNKRFVTHKHLFRRTLFRHQPDHTDQLFEQLRIYCPLRRYLFVSKVLRTFLKTSGNWGTENVLYETRNTSQRPLVVPRVNTYFYCKNIRICHHCILSYTKFNLFLYKVSIKPFSSLFYNVVYNCPKLIIFSTHAPAAA